MGNSASSGSYPNGGGGGGGDDLDQFDGIETLGYRVLGVQPNSPASQAGLVSFFDFLVGANGQRLLGSGEGLEEGEEYDDIDFPAMLQDNKGQPIELLVWNIKSQQQRFVDLIPNDNWGGTGLLGVTIRLDDYGGADERIIRVLSVEENSPAAIAGLVPMKDYLLGTTVTAFGSTETLAQVLQHFMDQVVEIYVYNSDSDVVRVVGLMPTFSWGGSGMLGAEVGTGYLHRLPSSSRGTSGQSVERKVRWMEKSEAEVAHANGTTVDQQQQQEQEQQQSASSSSQQQQQQPSAQRKPIDPTLEMERHLEMEVPPSEHVRPEEVTKQPHELGAATPRKQKAATTAGTAANNNDAASVFSTPPKQPVPENQQRQQQHQTPEQEIYVPPPQHQQQYQQQPSPMQGAESVFSTPPPVSPEPKLPTPQQQQQHQQQEAPHPSPSHAAPPIPGQKMTLAHPAFGVPQPAPMDGTIKPKSTLPSASYAPTGVTHPAFTLAKSMATPAPSSGGSGIVSPSNANVPVGPAGIPPPPAMSATSPLASTSDVDADTLFSRPPPSGESVASLTEIQQQQQQSSSSNNNSFMPPPPKMSFNQH